MPYPLFDRSRLVVKPLADRQHDLDLSAILPLDAPVPAFDHPAIDEVAKRMGEACERRRGSQPSIEF